MRLPRMASWKLSTLAVTETWSPSRNT
jgi:hypothetical protein